MWYMVTYSDIPNKRRLLKFGCREYFVYNLTSRTINWVLAPGVFFDIVALLSLFRCQNIIYCSKKDEKKQENLSI